MDRRDPAIIFATIFYAGYIPFAPGTFGTLMASLFCGLLKPTLYVQIILIPCLFITGVFITERAQDLLGEKDSPKIIIDEFLGYMVSVSMFDMTWMNLIMAFILFRFFDIMKPYPIRQIERRLSGGYSIMVDDILAGIYTNVSLRLLINIL